MPRQLFRETSKESDDIVVCATEEIVILLVPHKSEVIHVGKMFADMIREMKSLGFNISVKIGRSHKLSPMLFLCYYYN